jgi:hypothetical protein
MSHDTVAHEHVLALDVAVVVGMQQQRRDVSYG